ncbi:Cyclin N-terminal domain-containing protein [Balamuthia mandrillaris]
MACTLSNPASGASFYPLARLQLQTVHSNNITQTDDNDDCRDSRATATTCACKQRHQHNPQQQLLSSACGCPAAQSDKGDESPLTVRQSGLMENSFQDDLSHSNITTNHHTHHAATAESFFEEEEGEETQHAFEDDEGREERAGKWAIRKQTPGFVEHETGVEDQEGEEEEEEEEDEDQVQEEEVTDRPYRSTFSFAATVFPLKVDDDEEPEDADYDEEAERSAYEVMQVGRQDDYSNHFRGAVAASASAFRTDSMAHAPGWAMMSSTDTNNNSYSNTSSNFGFRHHHQPFATTQHNHNPSQYNHSQNQSHYHNNHHSQNQYYHSHHSHFLPQQHNYENNEEEQLDKAELYHEMQEKERRAARLSFSEEYMRARGVLVEWMTENGDKTLNLTSLTIHMAVTFMDRAISRQHFAASRLQLLAAACIFAAAKVEEQEQSVPSPTLLNRCCDDAYTEQLICKMELLLLQILDWELMVLTPRHFLEYFLEKGNVVDPSEDRMNDRTIPSEKVHLVQRYQRKYAEFFVDFCLHGTFLVCPFFLSFHLLFFSLPSCLLSCLGVHGFIFRCIFLLRIKYE